MVNSEVLLKALNRKGKEHDGKIGKEEVDLVHYDNIQSTGYHGHWRTFEVFQCEVCGAKTNYVHMGGYPGKHLVVVCPGTEYFEHDTLEKLIDKMSELNKRIKLINEGKSNPGIDEKKATGVIEGLDLELLIQMATIENLRHIFIRLSDVVGLDPAQVTEYKTIYAGGARISAHEHLKDAAKFLERIGYSESSAERDYYCRRY